MSQEFKVLGAEWCPFCIRVKKFLEKKGASLNWVDTETEQGRLERDALSKKYNYKTIPMVFAGDEFIGGCDDFFSAINRKKIDFGKL